jgi:hypothetical protein
MKEALTFLWFINFFGLALGGGNSGTGFCINNPSPFFGSGSELDPTYDSKAFTLATNDYFE